MSSQYQHRGKTVGGISGILDDWFGIESPKATVVDPVATANAQYQYNKQAAIDSAKYNAVDQYGPFGSTTYQRRDDGTPISQTINLSPQTQQWLDSQFGAATALQDATQKQLGYLPTDRFALPTNKSGTDYATEAFGSDLMNRMPSSGNIAQTSYDQAMAMIQPDLEAARKAKGIELVNRGIPVGSEIYNSEMTRLDTNEANARNSALRQAQLDAGNEETRQINAALAARGYGSNAYQQNLSNVMLERNQPYAEAAALMGTTPTFQTPTFMNTSALRIQSPDYTSTVNNNAAMQNAANNSSKSGLYSALGSIGSAALGSNTLMGKIFSDEDMKEDRHESDGESILVAFRDMPIDNYRYKDGPRKMFGLPEHRTGPMAQDYAEKFPEGSDGHMIDLGDFVGKLASAVKALDARTRNRAA